MTAADLAKILHEEFSRDHWGDIDPELFRLDPDWADEIRDVEGMKQVLARVVARLSP